MKDHINIPVFIPHLGCPNSCVFCNQRSISGHTAFCEESLEKEILTALSTVKPGTEAEIAFFGGSFTGIDRGLMLRLLAMAKKYIDGGQVTSVRLSTRPDYIDGEILAILSRYGVRHIELGIQSMDAAVLAAVRRGHSPEASEKACRLITERGFVLGGQMMVGLPRATPESEVATAEAICRMGASEARIYPTMVFSGTGLAEMTERGEYVPPDGEEMLSRTASVYRVFAEHGVKVLRIGLHAGEGLTGKDGIVAGAYHPAMGELVLGEIFRQRLAEAVGGMTPAEGKGLAVRVSPRELSRAVGQRGRNRRWLTEHFSFSEIRFIPDPAVADGQFTFEFFG